MCLQETKWLREKAKKVDSLGFKLCYKEKFRSRNRVYIIVDKEWKRHIVDVKTVGYQIITLKIIVEQHGPWVTFVGYDGSLYGCVVGQSHPLSENERRVLGGSENE